MRGAGGELLTSVESRPAGSSLLVSAEVNIRGRADVLTRWDGNTGVLSQKPNNKIVFVKTCHASAGPGPGLAMLPPATQSVQSVNKQLEGRTGPSTSPWGPRWMRVQGSAGARFCQRPNALSITAPEGRQGHPHSTRGGGGRGSPNQSAAELGLEPRSPDAQARPSPCEFGSRVLKRGTGIKPDPPPLPWDPRASPAQPQGRGRGRCSVW